MSQARDIAKALQLVNTDTNTIVTSAIDSDSLKSSVDKGINMPTGTIAVAVSGDLPTTTTTGSQALVTSTGRLYIFNGNGWYNIATINATPYWIDEASASYTLATDGTAIHVQIAAGDSDGTTPTYTATGDSSFNAIATVTKDSDQGFTIRSIDSDGSASKTAGSGILTFRASDGIDQASTASTFTISFTTDWATVSTSLTIIDGFDSNDYFGMGYSGLNTDGTYFVCGASGDDTDYNQRGVANVYYYNGGSWGLQTALAPPNADKKAELNFGSCCDIDGDGDTVVVSASNYGTYTGAIWVYTRSGTTWTYRTRLTASDGANYDQLGGDKNSRGLAISKDGTYIIAGARQDDDGGSNHGTAYIYTGSGASWSQQQKITPSSYSGSSNQFGFAVDINNDGTYCAVSANRWGSPDVGKVFIFTRSGSTWSEQASVTASDAASADNFGWHISMNGAGDRLLVYAKYDDDNYDSSGSIYVYTRSGSTWTQTAKLVKGDPTTSGFYYDYWGK